jgi:hypothetical protein
MMKTRGLLAATITAAVMLGSIAFSNGVTWAQDATPEAADATMPARPAQIKDGTSK